ncbi:hypothetical protein VOLCADRAFT_94079 [Volvox carteri f. nagariensis]|uniref:Uncharacterized protein n=1 Tax=Volvox carteri f. nagariensis TaxID=3068 RepID=D8U3V2_VOLCA|nr:uncharacterized protein VOLCADRAFT_94079 [Volvox carteri f. nagariensis]EFJ45674.1 hypothetical protein VOLCADRAFT_94079 [Volvox carteri f. nagariensis]|eukprot:XP_002953364.1 hypothetical protein VOLCADRAFT_94079 [Volvox carteri f. nagariensis]
MTVDLYYDRQDISFQGIKLTAANYTFCYTKRFLLVFALLQQDPCGGRLAVNVERECADSHELARQSPPLQAQPPQSMCRPPFLASGATCRCANCDGGHPIHCLHIVPGWEAAPVRAAGAHASPSPITQSLLSCWTGHSLRLHYLRSFWMTGSMESESVFTAGSCTIAVSGAVHGPLAPLALLFTSRVGGVEVKQALCGQLEFTDEVGSKDSCEVEMK